MEITGVAWFNSSRTVGVVVGVVVIVDNNNEEHSYIAGIDPNVINDEKDDAIEIAQWGARFPLDAGKDLVKRRGSNVNIKY